MVFACFGLEGFKIGTFFVSGVPRAGEDCYLASVVAHSYDWYMLSYHDKRDWSNPCTCSLVL